MKSAAGAFGALCLWSVSASALAAIFTSDKTDTGTTLIAIEGEIQLGDEKKFNEIAAKNDAAAVILNSDGGSTAAALKIGEAIRFKGYATAVFNGSSCNSACALIWLAGSPRALSKTAKIGFHATYVRVSGSDQESGLGNAIVGRYLTLLNLPERAVIFATSSSPSSLNFLTVANLASSGIDARVIEDLADSEGNSASQNRSLKSSSKKPEEITNWKKIGYWQVSVDHTLGDGCLIMASWIGGTVIRFGIRPNDSMSTYFLIGNDAWSSLTAGKEYDLRIQFDDETPWDVPAKVIQMGDGKFLSKSFHEDKFWSEFKAAKAITISYNGKQVDRLSLNQSDAAYSEMLRCQIDQPKIIRDPFAQ